MKQPKVLFKAIWFDPTTNWYGAITDNHYAVALCTKEKFESLPKLKVLLDKKWKNNILYLSRKKVIYTTKTKKDLVTDGVLTNTAISNKLQLTIPQELLDFYNVKS